MRCVKILTRNFLLAMRPCDTNIATLTHPPHPLFDMDSQDDAHDDRGLVARPVTPELFASSSFSVKPSTWARCARSAANWTVLEVVDYAAWRFFPDSDSKADGSGRAFAIPFVRVAYTTPDSDDAGADVEGGSSGGGKLRRARRRSPWMPLHTFHPLMHIWGRGDPCGSIQGDNSVVVKWLIAKLARSLCSHCVFPKALAAEPRM